MRRRGEIRQYPHQPHNPVIPIIVGLGISEISLFSHMVQISGDTRIDRYLPFFGDHCSELGALRFERQPMFNRFCIVRDTAL